MVTTIIWIIIWVHITMNRNGKKQKNETSVFLPHIYNLTRYFLSKFPLPKLGVVLIVGVVCLLFKIIRIRSHLIGQELGSQLLM